jgi:hypothetical protein
VRSERTTGLGSRGAGPPAEKKLSGATAFPRVRCCTWKRSIVEATAAADEEAPLGIVAIVVCGLGAVEEYVDEGVVVEVAGEA